MNNFKDFNIAPDFPLRGAKISITSVKNKPIILRDFKIIQKEELEDGEIKLTKINQIQFTFETETIDRITFTRSKIVRGQLERLDRSLLPLSCMFKEKDGCLYIE